MQANRRPPPQLFAHSLQQPMLAPSCSLAVAVSSSIAVGVVAAAGSLLDVAAAAHSLDVACECPLPAAFGFLRCCRRRRWLHQATRHCSSWLAVACRLAVVVVGMPLPPSLPLLRRGENHVFGYCTFINLMKELNEETLIFFGTSIKPFHVMMSFL